MTDGMSPMPDSPRPQGTDHYRADDDIDLPPMPDSDAANGDSDHRVSSSLEGKTRGVTSFLVAGALIAAVVVGGWFYVNPTSAEQQHENWEHVAAAAQASNDDAQQLVLVDASGTSTVAPTLELSSADMKIGGMQEIEVALKRNDLVTATAALQAAQGLPDPSVNPKVRLPTIDVEAAKSIAESRKELYQIELFDCCDEDGDIVEVLVNGKTFAAVPIMHQGTMLSIPLDSGSNTVTVRGVKDGGGGVTVSFRTSRGTYYARYMAVGEEHSMNVVVK